MVLCATDVGKRSADFLSGRISLPHTPGAHTGWEITIPRPFRRRTSLLPIRQLFPDGLGQELVFENGKDQAGIRLPEDVRVNDLVLRRALEAINEKSPHG